MGKKDKKDVEETKQEEAGTPKAETPVVEKEDGKKEEKVANKPPPVKKMSSVKKMSQEFKSKDPNSVLPELDYGQKYELVVKSKSVGQLVLGCIIPCYHTFHPEEFEVIGPQGKFMEITEESSTAQKLFCQGHRGLTWHVRSVSKDKDGNEVLGDELLKINRPLTCGRNACCHPQTVQTTATDALVPRANQEFPLQDGFVLTETISRKPKGDKCGCVRVPQYWVFNHKKQRIGHVNPIKVPCNSLPWSKVLCPPGLTVDSPDYSQNYTSINLKSKSSLNIENALVRKILDFFVPKNPRYIISFESDIVSNNTRLATLSSALLKHQLDTNRDLVQLYCGNVCIC